MEQTTPTATGQEQIPYWIPRDVYLPNKKAPSLSSSFSSRSSRADAPNDPPNSSSSSSPENVASNNDGNDDDDASSVWSTSTTSDLTAHSPVVPTNAATASPSGESKPRDIKLAVEATYNDLEDGIEMWPSMQSNCYPTATALVHQDGDQLQDIDDADDGEEDEEPLFDPFLLHSNAEADCSITFTEYYSHMEGEHYISSKQGNPATLGRDVLVTPSPTNSAVEVAMTAPGPQRTRTSCTPSPRRRMMRKQQRRCHSDLGTLNAAAAAAAAAARRKRRNFVPLHARMEMLQHQSQKPFRSVSRAIFGSVAKLHDRVVGPRLLGNGDRPKSPLKQSPAIQRGRMNVFRRKEDDLEARYQFDDASAVSSLPELRNVGSEETGRTLPLESSQTTALEGNEEDEEEELGEEMVYPVQFLVETAAKPGKMTPPTPTSDKNDENRDLRWLFARQQLPLTTPVHTIRDVNQMEESREKNEGNGHTLIDI